jgi:hypothetical protein
MLKGYGIPKQTISNSKTKLVHAEAARLFTELKLIADKPIPKEHVGMYVFIEKKGEMIKVLL